MKSKNITLLFMAIIAAATVFGSFTQPTVVHQVAVWAGGLFSLVLVGMVFLVRNWPETATKNEVSLKDAHDSANEVAQKMRGMSGTCFEQIRHLRDLGWTDKGISDATGYTIEQIKAVK